MAKKGGILNSIVAAVVGVAAGATAVILSDKKNRQAIQKKVGDVVEEGGERLEEVGKMVEGVIGKRSRKSVSKRKVSKKTAK